MKQQVVASRNSILLGSYAHLLKPLLFKTDPEFIHDSVSKTAEIAGVIPPARWITKALFGYTHPTLTTKVDGVWYKNPIGLSAGYDKNARLLRILPSMGFGFAEIGSITKDPYRGNEPPRLWRLPHSRSLGIYYGLMSDGADTVAKRLAHQRSSFPLGVSVAFTNDEKNTDIGRAVDDMLYTYETCGPHGSYITLNLSCPNTLSEQPFMIAKHAKQLLHTLATKRLNKPHYIKLSPDYSRAEIERLLDVALEFNVDGFICSNLTKNRQNSLIVERNIPPRGGMSGKVLEPLSNNLIEQVARYTGGQKTIVGVGGIFNAEDAYQKIRLGASLLQLITGMVYRGPSVISDINLGLVRLLKRDGFSSIAEAVGADVSSR
jgi:dihydroorotate dehydrogenase